MLLELAFFPLFLLCVLFALFVEIRKAHHRVRRVSQRTTEKPCSWQMRGTSGPPRRTKRSRYRCSLPGLAGFAGLRRTEPEVPRIDSRALKVRLRRKSSTPPCMKKENHTEIECIGLEKTKPPALHLRAPASERRVGDLDERVAIEEAFAPDRIEIVERLCGNGFLHSLAGGLQFLEPLAHR